MVNEDAPDLETLVEDSRNPHAVRQYIAMGDEISRLRTALATRDARIAELEADLVRMTKTVDYKDAGLHEMVMQKSADAALILRLEAECEALRADVVWAATKDVVVNNERSLLFHGSLYADRKTTQINGGYPGGTDAAIRRAVREARER